MYDFTSPGLLFHSDEEKERGRDTMTFHEPYHDEACTLLTQ